MNRTSDPERRLAAVWFADVVGYTTLSARDEDAALKVVAAFQRLSKELVARHSGRVVKFIGDAVLAEFASTDGAIRSALALMEGFNRDDDVRPYEATLRIGVNVGEVITAPDGDIYGDGVNLASRLQNQAAPGQVVASDAVHAQIRQRPIFRAEPLGERSVKGITNPVHLYSITLVEPALAGAAISGQEGAVDPAAGGAVAGATGRGAQAGAGRPRRGWGTRRRLVAAGVAAAAALAAVAYLDPGGFVRPALAPLSRGLRSGARIARTTYPVVEGGLEVEGSLVVEFTGAIDPATATSRNVQLLDPRGEPVPAEVSVASDQRSLTVAPTRTLRYAETYTLRLASSLLDAEGRPVLGTEGEVEGASLEIHTQALPEGEDLRPRLAPADGFDAERVPPAGPVRVRFTEAIDPASALAGGVRLTTGSGEPVRAALRFTDGNLELRVEPEGPLAAGERYVLRVDPSLTTPAGLPALADTFAFRVAPPTRQARTSAAGAESGTERPRPLPPPSGPGTLDLTVVPEAARPFVRVVVDGDTLGAPPLRGVRLAEGRTHEVTVVGVPEMSAYTLTVFERSVPVDPGQTIEIAAEIAPFGSIDVVSEPAGSVFIDGRPVGRTPLAGFPVTAGVVHRIEIRPSEADGARFTPFQGEFRVEPLEWKSLGRLELPPRGG